MFDDRKKRSEKEVEGCCSDEDALTSSEDCLKEEENDEGSGCQGCGV